MRRFFILTALAVLLGVSSASAQQIAVVSEDGTTTICQTLQAAIESASDGCVIYLPGGGFPLPDSVKITKKLTIIGIGHKSDNDNVDGSTTITGNLWFNEGSSGSAVMGCYITGNVNIGEGEATVNNVLVKCCNLNSVCVYNATCQGTYINQNYIRNTSYFSYSSAKITNNILHSISNVHGGTISYNIILGYSSIKSGYIYYYYAIVANSSTILNNIIRIKTHREDHTGTIYYYNILEGSDNHVNSNLSPCDFGDNPINVGDVDWNDVFEEWNGGAINPASNFHFKESYKQYESQVGVYANGVDFDKQIAPVPYIVAKRIADETDAAGQLKIQVRVKSGE